MANKRAENIKRLTITIDSDLLKELEEICAKSGRNRLEIIREAIASQLSKAKPKQKKKK